MWDSVLHQNVFTIIPIVVWSATSHLRGGSRAITPQSPSCLCRISACLTFIQSHPKLCTLRKKSSRSNRRDSVRHAWVFKGFEIFSTWHCIIISLVPLYQKKKKKKCWVWCYQLFGLFFLLPDMTHLDLTWNTKHLQRKLEKNGKQKPDTEFIKRCQETGWQPIQH